MGALRLENLRVDCYDFTRDPGTYMERIQGVTDAVSGYANGKGDTTELFMGLFDIFKKKEKTIVTIYSPINGKVIELKEVPDEAFAQKMVGDGCAIEPDKGVICSPIDGQLMNVFPTNHAIIFETIDGLEMIVHFGIDTVKLDGKGFQKLRE